MIIEICATTINSVINANKAGADRIELCSNYNVGGLTPSIEFIKESITFIFLIMIKMDCFQIFIKF